MKSMFFNLEAFIFEQHACHPSAFILHPCFSNGQMSTFNSSA